MCDPTTRFALLIGKLATCAASAYLAPGDVLFNPYAETSPLLRKWLKHRKVPFPKEWDHAPLAGASMEDMNTRGNDPSLSHFTTFTPNEASADFLICWLSWFGVTATDPGNKPELVRLVRKMLPLARRAKAKADVTTPPTAEFTEYMNRYLYASGRIQHTMLFFTCIHNFLQYSLEPEQFQHLMGSVAQASLTARKTRDYKGILSYVLGASALALPIVFNGRQKLMSVATSGIGKKTAAAVVNLFSTDSVKMIAGTELVSQIAKLMDQYDITDGKFVGKLGTATMIDMMRKNEFPIRVMRMLLRHALSGRASTYVPYALETIVRYIIK